MNVKCLVICLAHRKDSINTSCFHYCHQNNHSCKISWRKTGWAPPTPSSFMVHFPIIMAGLVTWCIWSQSRNRIICPDIYYFGLSASSSILRAYSGWFPVFCSSCLLKLHGSGKSEISTSSGRASRLEAQGRTDVSAHSKGCLGPEFLHWPWLFLLMSLPDCLRPTYPGYGGWSSYSKDTDLNINCI